MDNVALDEAFAVLGRHFKWHCDVEILLVGGAAGMVTGVLPPERTTVDCDVILYVPKQAWIAVESAADEIAGNLGLLPGWLNSRVQIRSDCLPQEWKKRRIWVATHGRLCVYAISRVDLIAMKFVAHRPQDLEDLQAMNVTAEEAAFVGSYLDDLENRGSNAQEIQEARVYLENWKLKP